MNHYLERIYKIMIEARRMAESGRWEHLEDYADAKLDEVISLANRALSSKSGAKESFAEDIRWEIFTTLVGSHNIDCEIGASKFTMSLNLEGSEPILEMS